jgi:putative tricarboxylic transport membrane protein
VFLYALPTLLSGRNKELPKLVINATIEKVDKFLNWISSIRGAIIGFFAGLIPGLTFTISSQFAYSVEKTLQSKSYKIGNSNCLAAAESANNSAIVSFLIPLLIFGIPISASEILIYDLVIGKGVVFNFNWFYNANSITFLATAFIVANILAFTAAWPLAKLLSNVVYKYNKAIFNLSLLLLFFTVVYVGVEKHDLGFYLSVSGILLPIGYMLRKYDCIPLIFAFMISNHFDRVIIQVIKLYF